MSRTSARFSQTSGSIPSRLAARLIDALALALAAAAMGSFIGFGFGWLLTSASLVVLYFVMMDVLCGATLGKFVMRLRVIGPTGLPPTLRQALTREAFTVVGAVPYVGRLLAIGVWAWILLSVRSSTRGQGKHDLLAGGTQVVRRAIVFGP